MNPEDTEHWMALEDRKFRCSLTQQRLLAGLTVEDLAKAMGRTLTDTILEVESENGDPHLSTLRRYAAAVGAIYHHRVIQLPPPADDTHDA